MKTSLQIVRDRIDPLLDDLMLDEEEREDLRDHIIADFDDRFNEGIDAAIAALSQSGIHAGDLLGKLKIVP